ncbi:hypothetical protein EON65_50965 [archaeon]|nr:MAG: hypothetical protein EON65_50965 [archaeon]
MYPTYYSLPAPPPQPTGPGLVLHHDDVLRLLYAAAVLGDHGQVFGSRQHNWFHSLRTLLVLLLWAYL